MQNMTRKKSNSESTTLKWFRKTHVLKKNICRKNPQGYSLIFFKILIEWPLIIDNSNIECCNTDSVGNRTNSLYVNQNLFLKTFAWKLDLPIIYQEMECYDCKMRLNTFTFRQYLYLYSSQVRIFVSIVVLQ